MKIMTAVGRFVPADRERKGQDPQQEPRCKDAVLCVLGCSLQRVGHGKRDDEDHDGDRYRGSTDHPAVLKDVIKRGISDYRMLPQPPPPVPP